MTPSPLRLAKVDLHPGPVKPVAYELIKKNTGPRAAAARERTGLRVRGRR